MLACSGCSRFPTLVKDRAISAKVAILLSVLFCLSIEFGTQQNAHKEEQDFGFLCIAGLLLCRCFCRCFCCCFVVVSIVENKTDGPAVL